MVKRVRFQLGSLKPKRRANGEKAWEFRYYGVDSQGQRQRKAVTVGSLSEYPTESAVRKSPAVMALLLQINADSARPASQPVTFGDVIARYEKEELPERYSTRSAYESNLRVHIKPRWAGVPLHMVKAMAVEDWLKGLKRAPKTRAHIRGLLHVIFQCAVRWELTDKNPIELVRVRGGSKRLKAPRVLTPEEFALIPPLLPEPYRTQVWVAGCLGLRASEIMPLKWSDFNFEDCTVLVQRSVVHGKVADTKTEASHDRVPLDAALVAVLKEHESRHHRTKEGWVFANPETDKPYHQDGVQQDYIRKAAIAAKLGDGIGWHTFRHSYRSWMDATHAPISVQKELMRHANISTTMNIYGKAMTDDKRRAHSKVVELLLKPKQPDAKGGADTALAATGS